MKSLKDGGGVSRRLWLLGSVALGSVLALTVRRQTAHAEMESIRDAARRLGGLSLHVCVMYSSSVPCPMCEAAACWAGIERMYHGSDIADRGAPQLRRC